MAGEVLIHNQTITNLASGGSVQTEVRNIFTKDFASGTPANTIIIQNQTNAKLKLDFNDGGFFLIAEAGQTISFDKETFIRYSQLRVLNETLAEATGDLFLTYAWLYSKFLPADQVN